MKQEHIIHDSIIYKNQNLLHTFPKLNEAFEVLFVIEGLKPASRQIIHEDEIDNVKQFCKANNLEYSVSDFKAVDTLLVVPEYPAKGDYFVYIAKNYEDARAAKFYEAVKANDKLGEKLGYPGCCRIFYDENYNKAVRIGDEYSIFSIENSTYPMSFLTNNMLRFFGISLIGHFPCSYNCRETIIQAEERLDCVRKYNPALADLIKEELSGIVISHVGTGIHALKGCSIAGNEVSYSDVLLTSPNRLHDTLKICNKIKLLGKHHVQLCQDSHIVDELKGEHVGVAVFR